jgi:hypothetical protein
MERRIHVGESAIEIDRNAKRHLSVLFFCFHPGSRRPEHDFPPYALARSWKQVFCAGCVVAARA